MHEKEYLFIVGSGGCASELESIDVEEFGTLSGLIKVTTKKPTNKIFDLNK